MRRLSQSASNTSTHGHWAILKPSQLPGEYTACATDMRFYKLNQSQELSLRSHVPIYSWVERGNYSLVSCSGTQVSRPGFEPTPY